MSKFIKQMMMLAIIAGFTSSSFAYWATPRGAHCVGGVCHNTNVHRGCVNGHCGAVRTSTWHRW